MGWLLFDLVVGAVNLACYFWGDGTVLGGSDWNLAAASFMFGLVPYEVTKL